MQTPSMIVKSQDVQPLHVLGTEVRFLCEGHRTNNVWSLMEVTLPQDAGPPPHSHDWDEAYFVSEGEVQFTVGDQCFTATTGDFVYTPSSVVHGFRGASQRPARVLIFDAPAHAGTFFKRVDREVKELPRDLPKVLDIGEETGIRFAQPA
jgi:quercetin dioxygenase-like cupin family protein